MDAKVKHDDIGPLYNRLAPVYDVWAKFTESRARRKALELADIKNGQSILEVAVGTGLAFFEIVKRNPTGQNTGIDLSEGMLNKARHRMRNLKGANYKLEIGSAFDLKEDRNSVDLLMNHYMFDLIPFEDMNAILLEFKRVLKPNGKLVLINMTEGRHLGNKIYNLIYKISPKMLGGCRGVELSGRLKKLGFIIDTSIYVEQMYFASEVILAHKQAE